MTKAEAAKMIVALYGEFQRVGYAEEKYAEAVALACAALLRSEENEGSDAE